MRTLSFAGAAALLAASLVGVASANEGEIPRGVPELDHVFVIMMENHSYSQIVGNPDQPYLNSLINGGKVSYARNYFGVGHPSLTNYLEAVGGSNFGVRSDNGPNFHSTTCQTNLHSGTPNADAGTGAPPFVIEQGTVCPISGFGSDAGTEAIDSWNEVYPPTPFNFLANIDGVKSVPQKTDVDGKTIADQIAAAGLSWKTYQESLPLAGPDDVTYSNGTVTDLTYGALPNLALLPAKPGGYIKAYAAKHNPFVYFRSVQEGTDPKVSYAQIAGFDGLYADLATGHVPAYSFIAPNQCNDQHGRSNGDSFCGLDPAPDGTQYGLNPGLIAQGDSTIQRLVSSIKNSPAWHDGHNAIVILWDENDYSGVAALNADGSYPATVSVTHPVNGVPTQMTVPAPNNNVLVTVETNYRKSPNVASNVYYNHFSLLKSIEAGLQLPCLNHACDKDVAVMSDLFAR